jgi:uncharacterized protein YdhG (YjbR/CyaY superfamily)
MSELAAERDSKVVNRSARKTTRRPGSRRRPRFNSVEDYLASLNDPTKARTIKSLIGLILAQFPELQSKISWNVPTIHRNGKYVAGIAAYKHHLTFSPWSPRVIADFKVRLGKFVLFKNCFQVPVDWEIDGEDGELVKDLVRARLAELD